jgi:uncharacterized repeat protein (TIGR01451 family)
VRRININKRFFTKHAALLFLQAVVLLVIVLSCADVQADILILHPSGAASGDSASYVGGTAATALDTNDGNSSYGRSNNSATDYYLEIDDHTTQSGIINSVVVKTYLRSGDFTIGLKTNGSSYFSSSQTQGSSYLLSSGNTYTTNPQTGLAWTWAQIDAVIAIIDHTNTSVMRVTELYVEVNYTDSTAPANITNLSTGTTTETSIQLTWTAPGDDGNSGTASTYDIRYRTDAPITSANWATATQVAGEPTPLVAETSQSFIVNNLLSATTYYFAIQTADEVPNWSGVSNSPIGATASDATAPANIVNLTTGTATETSIQLTWTAPGDDGNSGTASTYDIRYRTDAPITSANWTTSTQVAGEPTPLVAGTNQSFIVNNLLSATTYYFAIQTADEAPNWSGVSNSPIGATASDTTAPADIIDLSTGIVTNSSIELAWTAPGDDDTTGTATEYDIRYRTDTPITSANWATSTQAAGEPVPSIAGTNESFTVHSLLPATTYYFAMKTYDEVPNESGLSNVFSKATDNRLTTNLLLHPSGSATGDNVSYSGGTAETALDTNDGNSSYGRSDDSPNDYYLEIDDHTTQSGTINSVVVKTYLRSGDFIIGIKTNGSSYFGSAQTQGSSYSLFSGTTYTTNPQTGLPWTWAEIDALVAIIDHANYSVMRVTELYVEVNYIESITPADITDLATGTITENSIQLTWTAPGDDGNSGTASTYDIRYRTDAPITSANWATSTLIAGEPAPLVAGTSQSFTVNELSEGVTYYFAIKTADEVPNISGLSNIVTATTVLFQPDAMIKLSSEGDGSYLTNDIYEVAASTQTKSQGVISGSTASYALTFQNDGNTTDNLVITGTGTGSNFTVEYFDDTATDRTTDVTGTGYTISSLAAGQAMVWALNVTPSGNPTPVFGGVTYDVTITSTSASNSAKTDQVKATTFSNSANLSLLKSADRSTAVPGDEIIYTTVATNGPGLSDASTIVVSEAVDTNTGFKISGATFNPNTSTLTYVLDYRDNTGWGYVPADQGCSAPPGYDYCVEEVKWVMAGNMPTGTNFSVGLVVRVK